MSEFDDVDETDGETDETGAADIEVGAWCVAGKPGAQRSR